MEVTAKERRQVEEQVERLLSGQGSEVNLCDVGLELSKPATLRKNVTYIVCGVVFNDQVPQESLAPRRAASGPELPSHRDADPAGVRRGPEPGLDPAGPR